MTIVDPTCGILTVVSSSLGFDFAFIRRRAEFSRRYSYGQPLATDSFPRRDRRGGRKKEIPGVATRQEEDREERSRGVSSAGRHSAFLRRDFRARRAGVGLESTVSQDATVSCIRGDILANDLTALDYLLPRAAHFSGLPRRSSIRAPMRLKLFTASETVFVTTRDKSVVVAFLYFNGVSGEIELLAIRALIDVSVP